MRLLLSLILLMLALPATANLLDSRPAPLPGIPSVESPDFLPVSEAFRVSLAGESPQALTLRFTAAPGYYLYRHAFRFSIEPSALAAGEARIPDGLAKQDEYFGAVEVYYGITEVQLPVANPQGQPLTVEVRYQGCADKGLCYPPETLRLNLGQPASTGSDEPVARPLDWGSLALFLLAGLSLTFTPCVLPMLPILSGVVLRGQIGGLRGFSLSLAYVLPMALCFALLGALMGLFGAELNLQARLQSPWVLVPFATFFALFALAMFGLFELRLPRLISEPLDRLAGSTRGGSLWGAALLGVLSSLLVSPCVSAPLAGALLYISSTGDALGGGLRLFALGLGMGAPLVLFASGGGRLLPRSGAWMLAVRNFFGVMLLAVAVWLLERVIPGPASLALWGLLAAGVAIALLRMARRQPGSRALAAALPALLLAAYALSAGYGSLHGGSDPLRPWAGPRAQGEWQTLSQPAELDAALLAARQAGEPLLLDWYADWCMSCKVIEREVLEQPAVLEALTGYRLLRFDITASTAEQRALLDRYQLFGPPALMLFAPAGEEHADLRVVGEISAEAFLEKLRSANDRNR